MQERCAVGKARLPIPPLLQSMEQVGLEPTLPKELEPNRKPTCVVPHQQYCIIKWVRICDEMGVPPK